VSCGLFSRDQGCEELRAVKSLGLLEWFRAMNGLRVVYELMAVLGEPKRRIGSLSDRVKIDPAVPR